LPGFAVEVSRKGGGIGEAAGAGNVVYWGLGGLQPFFDGGNSRFCYGFPYRFTVQLPESSVRQGAGDSKMPYYIAYANLLFGMVGNVIQCVSDQMFGGLCRMC
jgi:hypothetical protein